MALLTPIVHCLLDPEPTSYHATDVAGEAATFAANLSFEAPASQTATKPEEIKQEIAEDEKEAELRIKRILAALQGLQFRVYQLVAPAANGLPYTLTLAQEAWKETLSVPIGENEASHELVYAWLKKQGPEDGSRYWSSPPLNPDDPHRQVDTEKAGAAPRLQAAQAWNAPTGHRQGLSHLVRLAPLPDDKIYVVLPFLDDPGGATPTEVTLVPNPEDGQQVDWANAAVECTYDVLGGLGTWTCRTNPVGRVGMDPIIKPPPAPPVDDALTTDGFLVVNNDAEAIRRFLKTFEERAASIMTATSALHLDGNEDARAMEKVFGFRIIGQPPGKPGDQDTREYHWGAAVWYVVSRLTAALDNHVLALLKPVANGDGWKSNIESEGEVLAPLVSAILAEMGELDIPGDFDGKTIAHAVRSVLLQHCPLVGNAELGPLLVSALRHVYGIANPKTAKVDNKPVLDPADPANLIASMLATYDKGAGYDLVAEEAKPMVLQLGKKSVEVLAASLIDLEQPLYDEAGSERTLIRLFETVELHVATLGQPTAEERVAYRIAAAVTNHDKPDGEPLRVPSDILVAAVASGWAKYKAVLEGPFNGAEAIRRAVGASFTDALLKKAGEDKAMVTAERLRELTSNARFYTWRLAQVQGEENCFAAMARPLVNPDNAFRPTVEELSQRLDEAYARAVMPLVTPPDKAARFTPDSFPMPLPIQIASGIDGSELDDFAKAFNGICVAVRRLDEKDSRWAHANLADLGWGDGQPAKASGVLHPMLPAAADGRGSMFIDYEGFPFAAPVAQQFSEDTAPGAQSLFYRPEPHDYSDKTFEPLPRLAYGRRFESFGFAISNAGVLPRALQKDPAQPWLPNAKIEKLFDGKWTPPEVFKTDYQRRTAIARMAVIEQPAAGASRRLGEAIAGVQPLSADYPRLGVVADKDLPGVIDLFRESDGAPRVHLPEKIERRLEWLIDELAWSGSPSSLTLHLFDSTPEAPDADGKLPKPTPINKNLDALRDLRLVAQDVGKTRTLKVFSGGQEQAEFLLEQAAASYWLRLELTTGSVASLSFASPEGLRSAGDSAPLVLLKSLPRKDENGVSAWRSDLPVAIDVRVSTPRVGYLDFMRWMANATLRDQAYGENADFEEALLIAYMMRHLDAELGQYLDNLPDPAVDAVRLELCETDSLTAIAPVQPISQEFQLGETIDDKGKKIAGRLADFVAKFKKPAQGWSPKRLKEELFKPLDEEFAFKVRLSAGASFSFAKLDNITVAGGSVAQLSMHALVLNSLFVGDELYPGVLHSGLKQFATRESTDSRRLSYPAAAIRIETMHDGIDARPDKDIGKWIAAAEAMIEAVPIANTRRFDIKTHDRLDYMEKGHVIIRAKRNDWRLIGAIDAITQRWRAGGRPIYHFIEPRRHAVDVKALTGPALPLRLDDTNDEVEQFESEAFFDRPDIDAQTVTQRLSPLGARTVLQQHSWDAPSATYFRHRFTLRSRYAGALALQFKRSVDAWKIKKNLPRKERGWTMRVAMLADTARLILTRPQLRALIPLTTAPGGENAGLPAPPVAAILQEPPYSRGGLADRIAPEIRTGFGYGFELEQPEPPTPAVPVEILDSRKEIGPSPQLDYRAYDAGQVLGLSLRGEGPLGLTFDMPDAPAPAFANTMLSLRPLSLSGPLPPLEEAMMAVVMRRYLDAHWLAGPDVVDQPDPDLAAERTWWIELVEPIRQPVRLSFGRPGGVTVPIAEIDAQAEAGYLVVSAWKEAIDKVKGYISPTVTVARVERRHIGAIAILHQPIAPGRYSTSILATPQSVRVADGESGLPLMLASFEWSGPDAPKDQGQAFEASRLIVNGARCKATETMASATTSLRWVQISRDFDFVRIVNQKADGEKLMGDRPVGKPHLARDLVARVAPDKKKMTFDLIKGDANVAVCSSTLGNPYPMHVHRHIGLITTRYLPELGRPVEVFCRNALAGGQATELPGASAGDEQAVRVVEFETPAAILCDKSLPAVPQAYKSSYFDLVATGYGKDNDIVVTIRFVGSAEHLGKFKKLTVFMSQPSADGLKMPADVDKLTVPIDLEKPKVPVVGLRLILRPDKGLLETWTLHADGAQAKPAKAQAIGALDLSGILPGFWLELGAERRAADGKEEFWADTSLLHGMKTPTAKEGDAAPKTGAVAASKVGKDEKAVPPAGPSLGFDFDWLFAPPQEGEAAAMVGPSGLSAMVEAQARIISVSPPIPIVRQ